MKSTAQLLSDEIECDCAALTSRARQVKKLAGVRANVAVGCIEAAVMALEKAMKSLREPSSGYYPLERDDPRREPND